MNIFIFGAGYSCRAFAAANAVGAEIIGTTRSEANFGRLEAAGIRPLLFGGRGNKEIRQALAQTTHLIVSIAPDNFTNPNKGVDCAVHMVRKVSMPNLRWIGYLSTVGVYGDYGGDWVSEESDCRPESRRSTLRMIAETQWMLFAHNRKVPLSILRLSGIYGPGRNAFVNLANGTAKRLVKPGQVFNRIHVADIAGSLWHLARGEDGYVFNITDDEPAPPQDVVTYAAGLMGVEPPPEIDFDKAELSEMARSFYGENKRVMNRLIKKYGYAFQFPNYRAALDAMWADGSWRGEGEADARSAIGP